jgi:signal transduction histidine kinase
MFTALTSFFDLDGLMPHGMCLVWRPDILWTQIIADSLIALAYFSIPAAIVYFARRRPSLPHVWVLYLFGAFIVWCGITHLASILTLWVPAYGLEALAKVITAAVSVLTAIMLWPLMPKALQIPSVGDLQIKNDQLELEIAERQLVERRLNDLTASLEHRVEERTRALTGANARLEDEIARRRQGEERLLKAITEADAANNAKNVFLAGMSHELRSPLNAILGFAQMLDQVYPQGLDAQQREYLRNIQTSGGLLLELIERLLDLSMIESGQNDVRFERVELAACIEKACAVLEPMARQANVTIAATGIEDTGIAVSVDPTRLSQILVNLGSNAIKYNRANGQVDISVVQVAEGKVIVKFTDTGIGIPSHLRSQVFQSFNRLNQDKSAIRGAGLGLALSKRLAEAMGGDLTFESVEGIGSVFSLIVRCA